MPLPRMMSPCRLVRGPTVRFRTRFACRNDGGTVVVPAPSFVIPAKAGIQGPILRHSRLPAASRCNAACLRARLSQDDRAILDLTLVVAYFNFVNRLADGLGVPLEESP